MPEFELISEMKPAGDQPRAIEALTDRLRRGERWSTLLGVTGSGKTFTLAHAIANLGKPTLVVSHNKTLAAQLYAEFKEMFPKNAVHYFVSYYDYYQPEAYLPQRDIYIEKDADINQDIDRLRLAATSDLLSRSDVIIVASVSCIYGLGSPEDYTRMVVPLKKHKTYPRDDLFRRFVDIQYERNDVEFGRGKYRVRGETIEIHPSYQETAVRLEFWGETLKRIAEVDPRSGEALAEKDEVVLYPAKHFVMPQEKVDRALESIRVELAERLAELKGAGKLLEAQRLEARTKYDLELMEEVGTCKGIENYSRHLSGRKPGERPAVLMDYFPKDYLVVVDESHVTIPQIRGMYNGDRARKETLIEHGFRLPSALDNRPLRFEEWEAIVPRAVFVSATPAPWELQQGGGTPVEQVIRPTGLLDPVIRIEPAQGQVPHLLGEIRKRAERKERVLVTTLTKRLAEELSGYLEEEKLRGRYLHSDIETLERVQILRELREGAFDVLVGVNLLREGLDLPEVTLVAILDADKEGFLRSATSIIQTIGRTARNVNGEVILYADTITPSMKQAIDETARRRARQEAYNREHGITPKTIEKGIRKGIEEILAAQKLVNRMVRLSEDEAEAARILAELEEEMFAAAERMEFERAAELRDLIRSYGGGGGGGARGRRGKGGGSRIRVKA